VEIGPLFQRIRKRKLVQWLIAYAAVAWGLLQVLDFLAENFAWNPLVVRITTVIVAMGFLATLVLAWYHGEQGRQRVSGAEVAIITGLVLVGAVAIGFLRRPIEGAPGDATPRTEAKLDAARVAVLPFRNTNPGDQESATLALGIHDDLLTRISRIRALRTVSRTSVEEYRGTTKQIRDIAAELGAGAILEGSVQRAGARVRINVQLIDGATDESLQLGIWLLSNRSTQPLDHALYSAKVLVCIETPAVNHCLHRAPMNPAHRNGSKTLRRRVGEHGRFRRQQLLHDLAERGAVAFEFRAPAPLYPR
jgi:TolB-like protein